VLSVVCVVLLLFPKVRQQESYLALLCIGVIVAVWIEKGMGMVVTGFEPTPLGRIVDYIPSGLEILITLGVYGIGFFILSVLYKIVVSVRERLEGV
jgi:molybdopterin-containing oxidoreductase family membrane subunit